MHYYALCILQTLPPSGIMQKNTLSLDCKTFVALQRLATRVKFAVTKPTEAPSDFWWQPGSRSVNVGELGAQNLDSSTFSHLNIQSVWGCLGQGPGQAAEVNRTTKSSVRLRGKSCWRWGGGVDGGGGIGGQDQQVGMGTCLGLGGTLTSRRLMMTAMAASSLPSLEAEEEGGLFFLALRAPCMIWSLKVMFPEFVPLVLLLFWRWRCLQVLLVKQKKEQTVFQPWFTNLLCSCCWESLWLLQQASAPSRLWPCTWLCPCPWPWPWPCPWTWPWPWPWPWARPCPWPGRWLGTLVEALDDWSLQLYSVKVIKQKKTIVPTNDDSGELRTILFNFCEGIAHACIHPHPWDSCQLK